MFEKCSMDTDLLFVKSILSDEMTAFGFPLIYKGELNHQVKKLFASMAETRLARSEKPDALRRKLYFIMLECLDNVTKHSDDYDDPTNPVGNGFFMVGEKRDYFYVITGNKIRKEHGTKLKEKIDNLNLLSKEQLTELHKKQMIEGELSEKGGAGLGLIEISRKTGEKLIYQFIHLDTDNDYFVLKVTISN